jgi:hypothetical protein
MAHSIMLPNMLANWKWPRRISPHYEEVKQASAAWLAGFGAFSPRAQQAFDRCDFSMWIAVLEVLMSCDEQTTDDSP